MLVFYCFLKKTIKFTKGNKIHATGRFFTSGRARNVDSCNFWGCFVSPGVSFDILGGCAMLCAIFENFENFENFRKTTKFNKIECLFTIFDVFGNLVCVWVVNIQRCMAAHSGARRHCAGTYQMQPFALPGGGKFQYFLKKDVFLFCN